MKNCKLHFFWPQKSRGGGGGKNVTMDVGHGNLHFSTPPPKKKKKNAICALLRCDSICIFVNDAGSWYTMVYQGLSWIIYLSSPPNTGTKLRSLPPSNNKHLRKFFLILGGISY